MELTNLVLVGSHTSPFVRAVRIFMHQRIAFDFKPIDYLKKEDADFLLQVNPVNKIPVLLANGKSLLDSRIIYQKLNQHFKIENLNDEEENILSCVYGAMDTTINLFMMKRFGIDIHQSNSYFDRNHARIQNLLEHLEKNSNLFSSWKFPSMLLYSYLEWATFRQMISLDSYSQLKKILETHKNQADVIATKIIT
jgi:glutathione S-transferase